LTRVRVRSRCAYTTMTGEVEIAVAAKVVISRRRGGADNHSLREAEHVPGIRI
jgi:hypothetical protein